MVDNSQVEYGGIKLFKLKQKAYDYYRLGTRGNHDISFMEARRKLTRNIMISKIVDRWLEGKDEYTIYMYGALKIETCNDLIIKVKQHRKKEEGFIFHHRKHEKLSKRLGLTK